MANASDIIAAIRTLRASLSPLGPITGGTSLMEALGADGLYQRHDPKRGFPNTLFGIPFEFSPLFPMVIDCAACGGTGEGGDEATYCPDCEGAGGHRTEGIVRNSEQTILMRSALPKKFAPSFPRDIPLPRQPATRSRVVPWPGSR